MFKQYRFIVALVVIGLLGGAFTQQVDASASAGDAKQAPKSEYNITQQQESNHWERILQKCFGKWQTQPQQQDKTETQFDRNKEQVNNPEQKEQATPEPEVEEKEEVVEKPQEQTDSNLHPFEQEVYELTNKEREKLGLTPLKLDTELSVVSRDKSQDMLNKQYFAHESPTYGSPFDMMQAYGIDYRTAGENIAKGQRSPEEVVNAWMNSPGHRENIVSPDFTHIGVGYVEQGNIWTQQFIGK